MEDCNNVTIKIACFNCKGLRSSLHDVKSLCETHDLVFLQETWLMPHNMSILHSIHDSFYGDGVSAVNTENGILVGRPYEGVAILWHKSLNICVKIIKDKNDSRLMGILIKRGDTTYHILNVYLPTESPDNLPNFTNYLYKKIHTLFQNNDTVYNMALGDFNTNLLKQSIFCSELIKFCHENDYVSR